MCESEDEVKAAEKDNKEGESPRRMHQRRIAELYLQCSPDDERNGAIVEKPYVDEEDEAEQIQRLDELLPLKVHGGVKWLGSRAHRCEDGLSLNRVVVIDRKSVV